MSGMCMLRGEGCVLQGREGRTFSSCLRLGGVQGFDACRSTHTQTRTRARKHTQTHTDTHRELGEDGVDVSGSNFVESAAQDRIYVRLVQVYDGLAELAV